MRPIGALLGAILLVAAAPAARGGDAPAGRWSDLECMGCHQQATPELTAAWRAGAHGGAAAAVRCIACHGDRHPGSAVKARRAATCIGCHGGAGAPVARSYLTSKHGVIATIEGPRWDHARPLSDGNYRAPNCAYCHFHQAGHGTGGDVADACLDCHSSRFTDVLSDAGRRGMAIGLAKVREAEAAIAARREGMDLSDAEEAELAALLRAMREGPLAGLRLGIVHQAPDFQWWLGQAALDGALLRIKASLSRLRRRKALGDP
ncbi:MAG: multiheme c-type cytochrome [Alphaproteobacteria bacterium]|jgi:hypothetical protein|nr:multiheme c-type cytochrome [Alphaproteobacteria bacterium]MDP6565738.1 multiheme c-type cytochrome [Alphaproteobacteria bacterium]MDP6814612.1 multiheme c-type cytochrome [Alphaproteobacteria bacterium]